MNFKPLAVPVVVAVLLAGAVAYLARPQKELFGTPPAAQVATVAIADITPERLGQTVAIEGTIVQECPHTGCWAIIRDASGRIRIDTQAGGFALPLRREGSRVRVVGEVRQTESGDLEISAHSAEL